MEGFFPLPRPEITSSLSSGWSAFPTTLVSCFFFPLPPIYESSFSWFESSLSLLMRRGRLAVYSSPPVPLAVPTLDDSSGDEPSQLLCPFSLPPTISVSLTFSFSFYFFEVKGGIRLGSPLFFFFAGIREEVPHFARLRLSGPKFSQPPSYYRPSLWRSSRF